MTGLIFFSACSSASDQNGTGADMATASDTGSVDSGVPDAGAFDAGAADLGTDMGMPVDFLLSVFDERWSATERTRMFWGLAEPESCYLFAGEEPGIQLRGEVEFSEGFSVDTWDWSLTEVGADTPTWVDAFIVSEQTIRLFQRTTNDGSTEVSDTFGGTSSDAPIVVTLNDENRPTQPSFIGPDVSVFRFVTQNGMGQSMNVDPQDHEFASATESFVVKGESYEGLRFVHTIDGSPVAAYGIVPAFGIVSIDTGDRVFDLCDFRVCAPTGCEGAPSCAELSCD